jgi:hypothetical protein
MKVSKIPKGKPAAFARGGKTKMFGAGDRTKSKSPAEPQRAGRTGHATKPALKRAGAKVRPVDQAGEMGGTGGVSSPHSLSVFVRDGGLLSYGVDTVDIFRRAATYVDRILRGEKPGDLPVQFPTKFEMLVNRKAANALGLAIPPSIMLRADEVIE